MRNNPETRKPIFIPTVLHGELKERATREQTSITGELLALVRDGKRYQALLVQPSERSQH